MAVSMVKSARESASTCMHACTGAQTQILTFMCAGGSIPGFHMCKLAACYAHVAAAVCAGALQSLPHQLAMQVDACIYVTLTCSKVAE